MVTPDIRIEFDGDNARGRVRFVFRSGISLTSQGNLNLGQVAALRRELRSILTTFVANVGDELSPTRANLIRGLKSLHEFGVNAIYLIAGGSRGAVRVHEEFRTVQRQKGILNPLFIEAIGDIEQVFPIEFLPILNFDFPSGDTLQSTKSLVEFGRAFIGFSSIVRRVLPDTPLASDVTINANPKLGIKFFHHAEIRAATDMKRFFNLQKVIDIADGPWPSAPLGATFSADFCRHLWNAGATFLQSAQIPPFAVIHLACHHVVQKSPDAEYLILSSGEQGVVDLAAMERNFINLRMDSQGTQKKPLVFLNACSGAVIDPLKPSSLPKSLLREDYLGFIGTEADVPDALASEFSQAFYLYWLGGCTLGEAILQARIELLWRGNPLGLLYNFYANPDLRLTLGSSEVQENGQKQYS